MNSKKLVACPLCKIVVEDLDYHKNICMAQEQKRTIEIREDCLECGEKVLNARYRIFCDKPCRIKNYNRKRRKYQAEWIRKKRAKIRVLTPT